MKIKKLISLLLAFTAVFAYSEETEFTLYTLSHTDLPVQIRAADVAGIGIIRYVPGRRDGMTEVSVTDYWTADPGTNIIHVMQNRRGEKVITLATNTPVVFFAMMHENLYAEDMPFRSTDYTPTFTNLQESAGLEFLGEDRAWFRTTRDNGIMYDYVTNLWECVRINPDIDKYYEVLRAGSNVRREDSWRVRADSEREIHRLFQEFPEQKLIQAKQNPLLSNYLKSRARVALKQRFGWWRDANGEIRPPPKPE